MDGAEPKNEKPTVMQRFPINNDWSGLRRPASRAQPHNGVASAYMTPSNINRPPVSTASRWYSALRNGCIVGRYHDELSPHNPRMRHASITWVSFQ